MPTHEELIETLLNKTTLPFSKVGIISVLARLRDERTIPHLIEMLEDENHYVRREAARAMGQLGSPEAIVPLLSVLDNETDEETRRNAITSLGMVGDETVLEALTRALNDPYYLIQRSAEMSLEQIQNRLGIQQPVTEELLKKSNTESPASVEEIPSYRDLLTESIPQDINVTSPNDSESNSSIPETGHRKTMMGAGVYNEYSESRISQQLGTSYEPLATQPRRASNTWLCRRCGDEVDSYFDVCQTCGGHIGEPGREGISTEYNTDSEEWAETELELKCPKCGEQMLNGYLFTESDDALIFNYQEDIEKENDVIVGRGTQMGCICLNCNLISFPFRAEAKTSSQKE